MTYQYQYILDDIRAGKTLPDRWPAEGEQEEEVTEDEDAPASTRWWEQEGKQLSDFPPLKGGRG